MEEFQQFLNFDVDSLKLSHYGKKLREHLRI
jgi:hypothetical protein